MHIECSAATICKASAKMLYNDKYHWLLIEDYALHVSAGVMRPQQQLHLMDTSTDTDTDELEPIESLMETLNFYMNTELTLAKRTPQDASYSLYDIWYVMWGVGTVCLWHC